MRGARARQVKRTVCPNAQCHGVNPTFGESQVIVYSQREERKHKRMGRGVILARDMLKS